MNVYVTDVAACVLQSEYDPKTPLERRKAAFAVRTTIKSTKSDADVQGIQKYREDYKSHVFGVCDARNDRLGQIVKARVLSALSDLLAADAHYHHSCCRTFFDLRSTTTSPSESPSFNSDHAFLLVCNKMLENRTKFWSSSELFDLYRENGGHLICKRTLLSKILDFHWESVIVLSSPGLENFVVFRSEAFY